MKEIALLLVVFSLFFDFVGQSNKDSIIVQFPENNKMSIHNYLDVENNKVYSFDDTYDALGLVVWDFWNMVPKARIELPMVGGNNFGKTKPRFSEMLDDSLVIYFSNVRVAISRLNQGMNSTDQSNTESNFDKTQTLRSKVNREYSFTIPNNGFGDSKGFYRVTGGSINKELDYVNQKKKYVVEIKSGNFLNYVSDLYSDSVTFKRYESYTKVCIEYSGENNWGCTFTKPISEFTTIAAAVDPGGSKLALLSSDYESLYLYNIIDNNSISLVDSFVVNLPDTMEFNIGFCGDDYNQIILTNKLGCEIVDIKTKDIAVNSFNFEVNNNGEFIIGEEVFTLAHYDRVFTHLINNRFVEVVVHCSKEWYEDNRYRTDNRNKGSYLSYGRLEGFKDYSCKHGDLNSNNLFTILIDTEAKKEIQIRGGGTFKPTSIKEVLTYFPCDNSYLSVFDASKNIEQKRLLLDKQPLPCGVHISDNTYNTMQLSNDRYSGDSKYVKIFPFFKSIRARSNYGGINTLLEDVSSNNSQNYFTQEISVDPGWTEYFNRFERENGTVLSSSDAEGEYVYEELREYKKEETSNTNSFTKASDNNHYFIEHFFRSSFYDSICKHLDTDVFVSICRYTDSIYENVEYVSGFKLAVFMNEKDVVFLIGSDKVASYNFITKKFIKQLPLGNTFKLNRFSNGFSDFDYSFKITDDDSHLIYTDVASNLRSLNIETGKDLIIDNIKSQLDASANFRKNIFSRNGKYYFYRDMDTAFVFNTITGEKIKAYKPQTHFEKDRYSSDSSQRFDYYYNSIFLSNTGIPIGNSFGREDKKIHFKYLNSPDTTFSMMNIAGNWLVSLPNGFYFGEQEAIKGVTFKKGSLAFPYTQFDHFYNRPDSVMQVVADFFGVENKDAINMLNKAYLKRLKKLGIRAMNELPQDIPILKIINKNKLPRSSKYLKINLEMTSKTSTLKELIVEINDVPVQKNKINNLHSFTTEINCNLIDGFNLIKIYCRDVNGNPSLAEYVTVYGDYPEAKPDLYIVTIGDSEYKDADFNLTYAAKDAKDIANLFGESEAYKNVKTKTLTNKEVTRENIKALRPFLEQANINDEVMIFVAGHGVLDENLDYFFATYDMDFNKPSDKGLAYEDLEGLLDGITPLKKTLLIDACHSGEIDKEEVELMAQEVTELGDVQFRSVGNLVSPKLGMQNTSELTKSLFTDLRKGTGATVISSAGGMEFAMESGDWKNGLFTFCLIKGLKTKAADLNNDGEIWLSELKQYVYSQVSLLSNGKQQPTSRIENNTIDYRVW
jgi:hypothetical protein